MLRSLVGQGPRGQPPCPAPQGCPRGAVTKVLASGRAGAWPCAGAEALGPGEAAHLTVARARLVHEGAVLTGPHGGRGGVRGAPDGTVLLEARKLHSDRACRAGRKETAVTRAPPSSAWQEERGLSRQLLWARAAAAQEALSWGPCLHPEPREMKPPSAEREAASCPPRCWRSPRRTTTGYPPPGEDVGVVSSCEGSCTRLHADVFTSPG